ncbi:hypothetical protein FJY93_03650, partial [Candidatus Kaiserbacteria bacterium]|nr:hypothetical protein [Candidatus Kaiserbacteria bacterium]
METLPSLTLSEAESFAKKAVREATPADMRGRCVDGRTEAGEGSGVYAMAGGDAGLLGVALAAAERLRGQGVAITDEQVRDAVFETIGGKESFSYHTDDHTPDGQYGCAHCKFMLRERSAEYGLSEDQVRFMEATLADLSDQRVKPMPLRGS